MTKPTAKNKKFVEFDSANYLLFENKEFNEQDFSNTHISTMQSINSRFNRCIFSHNKLGSFRPGSGCKQSVYIDCNFNNLQITAITPGNSRFINCSFHNVSLKNIFSHAMELIDCTFSGKMEKAVFQGTVPEDSQETLGRATNEFHGNDFSEMELIDVSFCSGIDLTKQKLPTSEDYLYIENLQEVLNILKDEVEYISSSQLKKHLDIFIKSSYYCYKKNQEQLFIRHEDLNDDVSIRNQLVDLLLKAEKKIKITLYKNFQRS